MAKLIKVDGTEKKVFPVNGKKFGLTELREMIGGTIQIQLKPTRGRGAKQCIVINDNGQLIGLEINKKASEIWREWYPNGECPYNDYKKLVGDVLLCGWNQIQ